MEWQLINANDKDKIHWGGRPRGWKDREEVHEWPTVMEIGGIAGSSKSILSDVERETAEKSKAK